MGDQLWNRSPSTLNYETTSCRRAPPHRNQQRALKDDPTLEVMKSQSVRQPAFVPSSPSPARSLASFSTCSWSLSLLFLPARSPACPPAYLLTPETGPPNLCLFSASPASSAFLSSLFLFNVFFLLRHEANPSRVDSFIASFSVFLFLLRFLFFRLTS